MRRKLLAGLAPLLVVSALVLPAAAQALPHWYQGKVLLTSPATVSTAGSLTFSSPSAVVKCTVADSEEIWNPVGGGAGQDLMLAFTASGCKVTKSTAACPKKGSTPTVVANGLSWPSFLKAGTPIVDEILKVRLIVGCSAGAIPQEYEGSLAPTVEKTKLVFGGPASTLENGLKEKLEVSGKDTLLGKFTAKDP